MKARWLLLAAVLLFAAGVAAPYILMKLTVENAEGWDAIWFILAAPGIYSVITWILWALAVILIIAAIVVYAKGKRRRRK